MKARTGIDPLELSRQDPRQRYLAKVCANLPPIGSKERAALRGTSKSLDEVIDFVKHQRDSGMMVDGADEGAPQ